MGSRRKSRRSLRVALVMGALVASTAVIGWGGLVAWSAYTENASNSAAAGTLSHANGASCVSSLGAVPTTGSHFCTATLTMGTPLQPPIAPLGADVGLGVTDLNTVAPDTGTVWAPTAPTGTFTATSLYSNAAAPILSWTGGGTAGTGTGATANTFTVTAAPGAGFATHYADAGASCTFGLLFSQTAA